MEDLGEGRVCFGLEALRTGKSREIRLLQTKYVSTIITSFRMDGSRPVDTPVETVKILRLLQLVVLLTHVGQVDFPFVRVLVVLCI